MRQFFTLLILMAVVLGMQAENYGINVGGVEVSDKNFNGVTGGNISAGTITYDKANKILTLNGVVIKRTGGDNYGVHNRSVAGLTIRFTGTTTITSDKANALHFDKNTTVQVAGTVNLKMTACANSNRGVVYANDGVSANFRGGGILNVTGTKGSQNPVCFEGKSNSSSELTFNNIKVNATSPASAMYKFKVVNFETGVDLKLTNTSGGYVMTEIGGGFTWGGSTACVTPADGKTEVLNNVCRHSSTGYCHITDDYGLIINTANFPDANFRTALWTYCSSGEQYLTKTQLQNLTSLNVSGKSISNLTGVNKLTNLTYLNCASNKLASLPTLPGKLVTLNCSNNTSLTALPTLPGTLINLYCSYCGLTSLPTLPSGLGVLSCGSNKFTTLSVTGKNELITLDCTNCTSLTTLYCYNNALTTLNVAGCSAMNMLNCQNNQLTSLGTLPGSLTTLNFANNQFSTLPTMPSGLETLNCSSNKFTKLTITQMAKLKTLDVSNNTSLTGLSIITNRALTSLTISGCTALTNLQCSSCALTSFPAIPGTVTNLDCSDNQLTSLPTLPGGLQELYCGYNKFTSLTITGKKSLNTLDVRNNTLLVSLNCSDNDLSMLTTANCTALKTLNCSSNSFAYMPSVPSSVTYFNCSNNGIIKQQSDLPAGLQTLNCANNSLQEVTLPALGSSGWNYALTSVNLSGNKFKNLVINFYKNLATLNVSDNTQLETLDCGANGLTELDVSGCTALTNLDCHWNNLTTLDVNTLAKLKKLMAYRNKLTTLTLPTEKTVLQSLSINDNEFDKLYVNGYTDLISLSVEQNPKLTYLDCSANGRLANLTVAGNTALHTLYCNENSLVDLDLSDLSSLVYLCCQDNLLKTLKYSSQATGLKSQMLWNNRLAGTAVDDMIASLPQGDRWTLFMLWDTDEHNVVTAAQAKAARAKDWVIKYYTGSGWLEYTGEDDHKRGDVTGDGVVDVGDINAIINIILGKAERTAAADLNGDNVIDVGDINAIINIILGKN